ncbi:hypothetical protein GJ744_008569 [Endocarpon pusillum]|uniref:Uncharacterized protein n=1 Tax=Endocarpon pusillum TaxID=364733 RepID=A0A8H7AGS6_9EURO|nr:hypothetical protein GJ744_008569 [Endocarpon pusillum]
MAGSSDTPPRLKLDVYGCLARRIQQFSTTVTDQHSLTWRTSTIDHRPSVVQDGSEFTMAYCLTTQQHRGSISATVLFGMVKA